MSEKDKKPDSTVTLDVGLEELLNIVSKVGSSSLGISDHSSKAAEVGRAWHEAVFKNIEKLSEAIETVRRVDLENVRVDLRERIDKLEARMEKEEASLHEYKRDVVRPLEKAMTELIALSKAEGKKSGGFWGGLTATIISVVIGVVIALIKYLWFGTP